MDPDPIISDQTTQDHIPATYKMWRDVVHCVVKMITEPVKAVKISGQMMAKSTKPCPHLLPVHYALAHGKTH